MRLSIILATYQRAALLRRTFPTLLAQQGVAGPEIIVVVDGSTDGTAAWLHGLGDPRVKVIEQQNAGPAAARNAGAAAASGDVLLFLDDDILCPPHLALFHLEAHAHSLSPKVVCGPVLVSDESRRGAPGDLARRETASGYRQLHQAGGRIEWPTSTLVDANSSLPRRLFLDAGGFDASFRRSETNELGFRLYQSGIPFEHLAAATAWQIFNKTPAEMCADAAWHARAELLLASRFPQYRPHCALASLGKGSRLRRFARHAAAAIPPQLLAALDVVDAPADATAQAVLFFRRAAALWRSAAAESGGWTPLLQRFGMRLPVLLYHHVGPLAPGSPSSMTIPPRTFERQMRWLVRHGYTAISTAQWCDWVAGKALLPPRPVLLTFDDSLADLCEHAFPIVKQLGLKAACYAVTGKLGRSNDWAGIQTGHDRLMTPAQLKEWSAAGIEFGAHTRTHPDLRSLRGAALEDEIAGSQRDLEDLLGCAVPSFAYTYGDFDPEVVACARRHFACSFTTDEGVNTLQTDLHLLRRTMVLPFDWMVDLRQRVEFGDSITIRLRGRVQARTRLRRAFGAGA